MIEIHGLTDAQVELCKQIYQCDSPESLDEFINTLPTDLRHTAWSLAQLMVISSIDHEVNTAQDCETAMELLAELKLVS